MPVSGTVSFIFKWVIGADKPTRVGKYIRVLSFESDLKNLTKVIYLRRIVDASTDGMLVQSTTKLLDCNLRNKDLLQTKMFQFNKLLN